MKNNREKHQIRFEIGIFETENTRVLKTHVREKHVCAENDQEQITSFKDEN